MTSLFEKQPTLLEKHKYGEGRLSQASFPVAFQILEEGSCAQLMLHIKSQCTLRAAGATFHSDAIREKLRGSNVALNGSVDHIVERKPSKIAQLTLLSDCDSAKAGCCGVSRFFLFSFFNCVIFSMLFAC